MDYNVTPVHQWRSQTRAHTGLGPGINISINFVVVTNWLT